MNKRRMRFACGLVLVVLLASCGPGRNTTMAVEHCLDGLLQGSDAPEHKRHHVIVSACAALFVEPDCRTAWEGSQMLPESARLKNVAHICRKAYCAMLDGPTPLLCVRPEMVSLGQDLQGPWSSLLWSILAHDLGETEARKVFPGLESLFASEPVTPPAENDKTATQPAPFLVYVYMGEDRSALFVTVARETQVEFEVPIIPSSSDFHPVVRYLQDQPDRGVIRISGADEVPDAVFEMLVEVLRDAGLEGR